MLEAQKEGEILNGDIQTQMCKMQRALWKGNVKFVDVYSFTVEGSVEEANVMNEVRQRIKEQGRVWWALEASKGVGWYLQPQLWEGNFVSSLSISTLANTIVLKRLIRQGIPPVFRPNIWFCASGAAKKRSTVPHSYYQDLIQAVQGMVTPATRQIDQLSLHGYVQLPLQGNQFIDTLLGSHLVLQIRRHGFELLMFGAYSQQTPASGFKSQTSFTVPQLISTLHMSSMTVDTFCVFDMQNKCQVVHVMISFLTGGQPRLRFVWGYKYPLGPSVDSGPLGTQKFPTHLGALYILQKFDHLSASTEICTSILYLTCLYALFCSDIARTFPTHPWLDTEEGHASLRRVLVAYSFRDSNVGYCQGLNYVAALLLLVMKTEEDAFWMMAVLLENVLFNDCYADNLSGCHVEQRVFKDLLAKMCPRITTHLENLKFDASLVATEWFLCLFAKSLPSEVWEYFCFSDKTTMRIWDVLFNEGANVLFRVALAIFKASCVFASMHNISSMTEDQLLAAQNIGDIINTLHYATHHSFDPDALLKVAFEKIGSMTIYSIRKHRKKRQAAVMAELEQRLKRLNSLENDRLPSSKNVGFK
eukprot:Gb_32768 [translate_table: standard]